MQHARQYSRDQTGVSLLRRSSLTCSSSVDARTTLAVPATSCGTTAGRGQPQPLSWQAGRFVRRPPHPARGQVIPASHAEQHRSSDARHLRRATDRRVLDPKRAPPITPRPGVLVPRTAAARPELAVTKIPRDASWWRCPLHCFDTQLQDELFPREASGIPSGYLPVSFPIGGLRKIHLESPRRISRGLRGGARQN